MKDAEEKSYLSSFKEPHEQLDSWENALLLRFCVRFLIFKVFKVNFLLKKCDFNQYFNDFFNTGMTVFERFNTGISVLQNDPGSRDTGIDKTGIAPTNYKFWKFLQRIQI